jgi:SSS family solute:Na+ symporter
LLVAAIGVIGSLYALWGGLRTVAVSDLLNGFLLLSGGFIIVYFAMTKLGDGSFLAGFEQLRLRTPGKFNSIGGPNTNVPFGTIFTGILLLNLFYWCTNQQIIQRTFGASSLAEGQKGVLLTGALKLLGPMYLVLPGIIAFALFQGETIQGSAVYGKLVHAVLPKALSGFFAAALLGAILSSFNSALNSTCTLFSLGLYKTMIRKDATEKQVVNSGKYFGWIIAIISMAVAPLLDGQESIFGYLQQMNCIYFIPIFSVVLVGMLSRRVPPIAAKLALILGFLAIVIGYYVPPFNIIVASLHNFHFVGIVFFYLVIMMLIIGEVCPLEKEWVQEDVKAIDMTPWKHTRKAGLALLAIVLTIYIVFADFSVLKKEEPAKPAEPPKIEQKAVAE